MDDSVVNKMRLVVVLAGGRVPGWLRSLIDSLHESDSVDVQAIVAITDEGDATNSSTLLRFWKRLDQGLFERDRPVDLDVSYSRESINDLPLPVADVVVWMCPHRPPVGLLSKVKYGFVSIANSFRLEYGLAEFIGGQPATECHVVRFGKSPGEDLILATGAVATDGLSLTRGLVELRAVGNTLLVATLSRLRSYGDSGVPVPQLDVPGVLRLVAGLTGLYLRYLVRFPSRFFAFDQWQMAYRVGGERLDQSGLTRLAPDHGGFWADPFVIEHDDRKMLFFEEFSEELGRGHIAVMEFQADGRFDDPVSVLMCPYHLSYPFVFEFDGSLFMIPESAEAKKVEVFSCTRFPDVWEPHSTLFDGVRAYDATLVEHEGQWWMFMTIQQGGNSPNEALHLFYADSPFADWTPHPLNPIGLDVRNSRPAGKLFRDNGRLYRPAQNCSGRYGRAIVIREVRRMTTTEYEEVTASEISCAWAGDAHATHTINQSAGITVYDCEVRRGKRGINSSRSNRQQPISHATD